MTDPRPENPVGKTYTVDGLGNVIGGRLTVYNNQPIGNFKEWMPKKYRTSSHKKLASHGDELKCSKSPLFSGQCIVCLKYYSSCVSEFFSKNIDFSLRNNRAII